jgi:spermidine/putrescine transport system substrate-binding protein
VGHCKANGRILSGRIVNRRNVIKGAAAGVAMMAAPFLVKNAFATSGELNLLAWPDEWPMPVLQNFTTRTGIKVNVIPVAHNDEQVAKLQATDVVADLCQPSGDRAPLFQAQGVLQPFDLARIATDRILTPALAASSSLWTWDGGLHHLPHVWGAEAMAWRTDKWRRDYANLSYGDLWSDGLRGKILVRPQSMLLGIGLWLDRSGNFPSNRMLDAFKDETSMKQIWTEVTRFAIEHKSWIKQLWATADDVRAGLTSGDCAVGQTWDGPALTLKKAGQPVTFMAPQEGAIAWFDGLSLAKSARNVDQAYALLNYLYTAEVGAEIADGSGYNSAADGALTRLPDTVQKIFNDAYPANALANLWWRQPEPAWYTPLRNDFVAKFNAA